MTIVRKEDGAEVYLNSDYEDNLFNEKGIKGFNFLNKLSPYDIFKDNDSFYSSFRDNDKFGFIKINKIISKNEIILYSNDNLDQIIFDYSKVLDTYNRKYNKNINEIDFLIEKLKTNKEEFIETFNPNFIKNKNINSSKIIDIYIDNYINVLEIYKDIIANDKLTSAEIRNKINSINCLPNDIIFKQNGFNSLINSFEQFVSHNNENSQLFRFKENLKNNNINLNMSQEEFKQTVLELNGMLNRSILCESENLLLIKETTNGYNDYYLYKNEDNLINLIDHSDNLEYMYVEFDNNNNDTLNMDL